MNPISSQLRVPERKGPNNRRAWLIQECADLCSVPFKVMMGKLMHLQGDRGLEAIEDMLDMARRASYEGKWRRIKMYQLIKASKIV